MCLISSVTVLNLERPVQLDPAVVRLVYRVPCGRGELYASTAPAHDVRLASVLFTVGFVLARIVGGTSEDGEETDEKNTESGHGCADDADVDLDR